MIEQLYGCGINHNRLQPPSPSPNSKEIKPGSGAGGRATGSSSPISPQLPTLITES